MAPFHVAPVIVPPEVTFIAFECNVNEPGLDVAPMTVFAPEFEDSVELPLIWPSP